jgi:hypothetical protein
MTWRDHLVARLKEIRPNSVCALDAAAYQLARDILPDTLVLMPGDPPAQACMLALGIDALIGLDAQQAQHLINHVRLYLSPRLLLVAQETCALNESSFRALGFTLSLNDPADRTRVYHYDLDVYKTVPDWLNSRFWAHPERWKP